MAAAEKRIAERQQWGIKDIDSVKRKQKRNLILQKLEEEAGDMSGQGKLKVQCMINVMQRRLEIYIFYIY